MVSSVMNGRGLQSSPGSGPAVLDNPYNPAYLYMDESYNNTIVKVSLANGATVATLHGRIMRVRFLH